MPSNLDGHGVACEMRWEWRTRRRSLHGAGSQGFRDFHLNIRLPCGRIVHRPSSAPLAHDLLVSGTALDVPVVGHGLGEPLGFVWLFGEDGVAFERDDPALPAASVTVRL